MNKTKIEWCDYTWNPVTGCLHGCDYCYARRMAHRFGRSFEPKFHAERLNQPRGVTKPSRIFVCSAGDLFGEWVPINWIWDVKDAIRLAPQHTYIFLTKNPKRYQDIIGPWPKNCWLGTTVTNQPDADLRIPDLLRAKSRVLYVSVEPMMGAVDFLNIQWPAKHQVDVLRGGYWSKKWGFVNHSDFPGLVNWLILGAMTGPGSKDRQPKPEWIEGLVDQARAANVPVFLKDNLHWPEKIQEWPREK